VVILEGDGNLFWAKGMHNSWRKALEKNYEFYFLINDDVELYENIFDQLWSTHEHCLESYNTSGIYIGATEDKKKGILTYSGSKILNKFLYTQKRLPPDGTFQLCDLANANIMMVPNTVVEQIGIISADYSHGIADYDYTLRATRKKIPVLVAPQYCGHCEYDHKDPYDGFSEKSLENRRKYLHSPTGLAQTSYNSYMRKFFPWRYPLVVFFGWFKLYFPSVYIRYFRNR
jgi:GT2 family glycosyltransferase